MYNNTYKGKYKIKKPEKYEGNTTEVVYRSLWERAVFVWCERNPSVANWSSEEVIIPYYDVGKGKPRRYHMDMKITFTDGRTILVEVKPKKQMKPPSKRLKRARYLEEKATYVTNTCKWTAAEQYTKARGWGFQIWNEDTLKKMGILKK